MGDICSAPSVGHVIKVQGQTADFMKLYHQFQVSDQGQGQTASILLIS